MRLLAPTLARCAMLFASGAAAAAGSHGPEVVKGSDGLEAHIWTRGSGPRGAGPVRVALARAAGCKSGTAESGAAAPEGSAANPAAGAAPAADAADSGGAAASEGSVGDPATGTECASAGAAVRLRWNEVLEGLQAESPALRRLLSKVLKDMPFPAFFWECAPVSLVTKAARPFEFVVLDAPQLGRVRADPEPFAEHLEAYRDQEIARSFANLGGDSLLVAPAQVGPDPENYAHLGRFIRLAPEAQQDAQWRRLGEALEEQLLRVGQKNSVWVSTEGSGVYWVHMRLDARPKYYHFKDFVDPGYHASDQL